MSKKDLIKFISDVGDYQVQHENGCVLGQLIVKEDGFYDFWPDLKGGCWPSYILREIADKLDELNAPLEAQMEEYFQKQKEFDDKYLNDHLEYLGSE